MAGFHLKVKFREALSIALSPSPSLLFFSFVFVPLFSSLEMP